MRISLTAASRASLAFLLFGAAVPLSATTLASGTISIDGTETTTGPNRVFRDGIASTFAAPKAFPGTFPCGTPCGFRTVTVTPVFPRVTVTLTGATNAINVFTVGYLNSFNPASLSTNYLGDPGSSSATGVTQTFEVTVPAGGQLVLAFMNDNGGTTGTVNYQVDDAPLPIPTMSPLALALLAVMMAGSAKLALRKVHTPIG
jgi:hypothetical protein